MSPTAARISIAASPTADYPASKGFLALSAAILPALLWIGGRVLRDRRVAARDE